MARANQASIDIAIRTFTYLCADDWRFTKRLNSHDTGMFEMMYMSIDLAMLLENIHKNPYAKPVKFN